MVISSLLQETNERKTERRARSCIPSCEGNQESRGRRPQYARRNTQRFQQGEHDGFRRSSRQGFLATGLLRRAIFRTRPLRTVTAHLHLGSPHTGTHISSQPRTLPTEPCIHSLDSFPRCSPFLHAIAHIFFQCRQCRISFFTLPTCPPTLRTCPTRRTPPNTTGRIFHYLGILRRRLVPCHER